MGERVIDGERANGPGAREIGIGKIAEGMLDVDGGLIVAVGDKGNNPCAYS
jgi:hypothetical protein